MAEEKRREGGESSKEGGKARGMHACMLQTEDQCVDSEMMDLTVDDPHLLK